MNTWILLMQVFLVSAGAVSVAIGVSFSLPTALNEALGVWSIILSLLRPPYLHLLINVIIITIAASSRFRQSQSDPPPVQSQHLISVRTPPPGYFTAYSAQPEVRTIVEVPQAAAAAYDDTDKVVELRPVMLNGSEVDIEEAATDGETDDEDAFCDRMLTHYNLPPEKPIRDIHETTHARYETLESAWKKIMEGASRASYEAPEQVRHVDPSPPSSFQDNMSKSKSFKRRNGSENSLPGRTSSGIQKESSPSRDELNQRVEAFIKKVNHEMRLQRQETINQLYGRS